jgi:hypothetical protein
MKTMAQISPNSKDFFFNLLDFQNKFKAGSQEYKTIFFPLLSYFVCNCEPWIIAQ